MINFIGTPIVPLFNLRKYLFDFCSRGSQERANNSHDEADSGPRLKILRQSSSQLFKPAQAWSEKILHRLFSQTCLRHNVSIGYAYSKAAKGFFTRVGQLQGSFHISAFAKQILLTSTPLVPALRPINSTRPTFLASQTATKVAVRGPQAWVVKRVPTSKSRRKEDGKNGFMGLAECWDRHTSNWPSRATL